MIVCVAYMSHVILYGVYLIALRCDVCVCLSCVRFGTPVAWVTAAALSDVALLLSYPSPLPPH